MEDRRDILLRAAYDLLTRAERGHFVLEAAGIETFYDKANCDGYCLREDIADVLNLNEETDPIPLQPERK